MPERFSATHLFVALLLVIFFAEGAMMFLLDALDSQRIPVWMEAIVDAGVLTALTSVLVWRLFMRPLKYALQSESARAKAVTDSAAEGIIVIDERGNIETFNRAAEGMFAWRSKDVIGRNVKILVPELQTSENDMDTASYSNVEASLKVQPREVQALRKDGTVFPIEVNITEIRVGGSRRFAGIVRDVTERKRAEERIRRLAHFDALTGVPNRALFYDRLDQAIRFANRNRHGLALLYLDLDKFKPINDTFGHEAGDEVLKTVAERLRQCVRESDTIARLGGDEFVVILPKITERGNAVIVAEKLIDGLSASFCLSGSNQTVHLGVSIGIAVFPDDANTAELLLREADAAMYDAKQTGSTYRFGQGGDDHRRVKAH